MEIIETNEKYDFSRRPILDRSNIKKDFRRYTPASLATINTPNSLINIDIPREDAYICLDDAYIQLELVVTTQAGARYEDDAAVSLVNLGGIALFSEATLSTSSRKHLERIEQVYQASLMYKLLADSQEDLDINFTKDTDPAAINAKLRNRLINDNPEKGTLCLDILLSDIFGFALHQDNITYGLGFQLSLKRANDNNALFRVNATTADAAKIIINDISFCSLYSFIRESNSCS